MRREHFSEIHSRHSARGGEKGACVTVARHVKIPMLRPPELLYKSLHFVRRAQIGVVRGLLRQAQGPRDDFSFFERILLKEIKAFDDADRRCRSFRLLAHHYLLPPSIYPRTRRQPTGRNRPACSANSCADRRLAIAPCALNSGIALSHAQLRAGTGANLAGTVD